MDVIAVLNKIKVSYLMPCRNTGAVVDAIGEFEAGKCKRKVIPCTITGSDGSEPYTMVIIKRKRRRRVAGSAPHEKYIGFTTNVPDIDVEEYGRRWGIETRYRIIENARIRTHSKNPAVRLLYFVYSTCMFNAWVMANYLLAYRAGIYREDLLLTQQEMRDALMLSCVFDYEPLEPPLPVPP